MPSIYLSPSTQEYNTTVLGNSEEYYMNLIADAMEPYLAASGIRFGRNDPAMTALDSARQANEGGYDFYLALHSNAAPDPYAGTVRGAEIYYFPGSREGQRAATIFANNYKEIYPLPDRIKILPLGTFIELNKTNMPAILFELAYHDNLLDASWLSRNINEIARNLAISVADYFGVEFVDVRYFGQAVISTDGGAVNVREKPDINSPVVAALPDGTVVKVFERVNDWFLIEDGSTAGFVNAEFIRQL